MPRGVVTVGAITCGLRFARKAVKFRFNSVIDSIYYFSVEEIHSMANGHGSAWYFYRNASTTKYLQNASLLNTWPLVYYTLLMPRSSTTSQTWACPTLFRSSPTAQPATIVLRPSYFLVCSSPHRYCAVPAVPCPTPISSTVLP